MYITYLNPPKTRQITFDEILAGVQNVEALHYGGSNTSTIDRVSQRFNRQTSRYHQCS